MSRLQSYILNELNSLEGIVDILHNQCQQYLKELAGCSDFLYRGQFSIAITDIERIIPRTNRKPRNTPQEIHEIWDKEFKKKFGWKSRSEGVFVSSDFDMVEGFGRPYVFFPIGLYKYVWSKKHMDVTNDMDHIVYEYFYDKERKVDTTLRKIWYLENVKDRDKWDDEELFNEWKKKNVDRIDREMIDVCKSIVNNYIKGNMKDAIKYGNEMSFKCESYYLVNIMFADDLKGILL